VTPHRLASFRALLAGLAFGLILAATPHLLSAQSIVPGFRAPGKFDPEQWRRDMETLHAGLEKDGLLVPKSQRLVIAPDAEDLDRIGTSDCSNCGDGAQGSGRMQVGVAKPVDALVQFGASDLAAMKSGGVLGLPGGLARLTADGRLVATISTEAIDAGGVRIEFQDFDLPEGLEVVVYNDGGEAYGPYTGRGVMNDGHFWSHTAGGPVVHVELRSRGPVTEAQLRKARLRIAGIGYIDRQFFIPLAEEKQICSLESCFRDRTCFTTTDWAPINDVSDAVGHMLFQIGGSFFICSGGLVNDTDANTVRNWFLSANHCFNTQAAATSLQTFFRYKTATCNGTCPASSSFPSTIGSTLRATSSTTDFLFLELSQNPPAGSFYLGYRTDNVANTNNFALHRISHPKGAAQTYTRESVKTSGVLTCLGFSRPSFIYSQDTLGATAGGSSGSPVLDAAGLIVGQLFGVCAPPGTVDPCSSSNSIIDGAFAVTFSSIQSFLEPPPTAPPNDNFASAVTLAGASGSQPGGNANATKQTGEPNHAGNAGGRSVWYQWTPPAGQWARFSTTGASFTTLLAVYTGGAVNALTEVVSTQSGQTPVFLAEPGTTYRIAVDGLNATSGSFTLNWTTVAPPNDAFASATVLTGNSGTLKDSNTTATKETGEPAHAGGTGGASIWYRWTAPASGTVVFTTAGSTIDTLLGVYTGTAVGALTQIAANDDENFAANILTSRVQFSAVGGTTYRIAVDGFRSSGVAAQGIIQFAWTLDVPTIPGDVSGDGAVTPVDAQHAFECFLNSSCAGGLNAQAADFCANGAITPADAQGIFNHFLGITPACP